MCFPWDFGSAYQCFGSNKDESQLMPVNQDTIGTVTSCCALGRTQIGRPVETDIVDTQWQSFKRSPTFKQGC